MHNSILLQNCIDFSVYKFLSQFCLLLFDVEWLGTIVQEHKETFDPNCPRDFIDAFLAEKKKGKDESFSVRLIYDIALKSFKYPFISLAYCK